MSSDSLLNGTLRVQDGTIEFVGDVPSDEFGHPQGRDSVRVRVLMHANGTCEVERIVGPADPDDAEVVATVWDWISTYWFQSISNHMCDVGCDEVGWRVGVNRDR